MGHSGASVLLVDPEVEADLAGIDVPHRFVLGAESDEVLFPADAGDAGGEAPLEWPADEDATATINYTSGTTARPKGVQLTHRNCWVNASLFGWHMEVSDRDVYLHTLPMFHANGWGMPWATTAMGCPQVALRKVDGTEILRRVQRHGVSLLCAAPAVVNAVLEAAPEWDGPIPGRDRTRVVVAGAPPPSRTIERVQTELGWQFNQIYGLTETSPLLTINRHRTEWDDHDHGHRARKLMRAGVPAVGTSLRVGADGEVVARSNTVMEGYWNQPEETARALGGGWFHTGDGGLVDEEGHLSILDRKKDVIITGGENVSSIEVEDAIFSMEGVAEVAVIGIPDERWGEMVIALVVPADGAAPDRGAGHRPLPHGAGRVQVPQAGGAARRAAPHGHRQAPEVPPAGPLLGGTGPPGQLTAAVGGGPGAAWTARRRPPRPPRPHRRPRRPTTPTPSGRSTPVLPAWGRARRRAPPRGATRDGRRPSVGPTPPGPARRGLRAGAGWAGSARPRRAMVWAGRARRADSERADRR